MSKKFIGKIIGIVSLFTIILTLTACKRNDFTQMQYFSLDYFSTETTLVLIDDFNSNETKLKAKNCWNEINDLLKTLDNTFSLARSSSDIYKFNQAKGGEKIEISKHTYDLLDIALGCYNFTNGAYNPAVFWLVDLWGFTPRFYDSIFVPTEIYDRQSINQAPLSAEHQNYIEQFKTLTKFNKVELEKKSNKYYVTKPMDSITIGKKTYTMNIDIGGIAKGYAVDLANGIIDKYDFDYGYFSIGSSSIAMKQFPQKVNENIENGNWRINLVNPLYKLKDNANKGDINATNKYAPNYANIYAKDQTVSTSGNYERYYIDNNKLYCHIIDASTGSPIDNGMQSCTILGASASINDALTTALCVMGKDKAIKFVKDNLEDYIVSMMFVQNSKNYIWSNINSKYFEVLEPTFSLWEP